MRGVSGGGASGKGVADDVTVEGRGAGGRVVGRACALPQERLVLWCYGGLGVFTLG